MKPSRRERWELARHAGLGLFKVQMLTLGAIVAVIILGYSVICHRLEDGAQF